VSFVRLLAATAVLAGLVLPATAGAASHTTGLLDVAAGVAHKYWGAVPCGGQVKVIAQRPLTAGAEPGTDAWVTFASPLGANDLAAPDATYTACTIAFGRSRWPTTESMRQDWDMLCLTMVHEMGHLLGHAHDTTPGSVMAPIFTDLSAEPQRCRTARPAATT
jgi:hypothetical protein